MDLHRLPIDNYSFIEWLGRNDVFHPANELEFIIVNLLNVADRRTDNSTRLIVFPDEGADNIIKLVVIAVFHVHLGDFLEWSNFIRKHHVCVH